MKSEAPAFSIDIIYMIYLDVKYFSVVCLSIYYEKPAVKTTLTTIAHFFAKNLNYCPSGIICSSVALKCQCFETHLKKINSFKLIKLINLILVFCMSNKS